MEQSRNMSPDGDGNVHALGEALAGVNLGTKHKQPGSSNNLAALDNEWGNFADTTTVSNSETIGMFLRQSPSQSLGEDVFKLSHTNLPALAEASSANAFRYSSHNLAPGPSTSTGDLRVAAEGTRSRRTESPSCSATGTTSRTSSRSVSPYASASDTARVIHAYHGYEPGTDIIGRNQSVYTEEDRSSPYTTLSHGHGSHPSLGTLDSRSPYKNVLSSSSSSPLDANRVETTTPVTLPSQQSSQVLYMAVPSPDGRGQVLQPVQMVQVPGKPYQLVTAQPDGSMMTLPPLAGNAEPRTGAPLENRSRVANYAMDNSTARPQQPQPYLEHSTSSQDLRAAASFPIDSAVASLYASPQRPPLDALLGQIRRLSRDQVGCRLVQQALDEEGPMAATLVLNEGLPFWGEAMVDPFGNYLFQKILEKVTPEERIVLVKSVAPRLVNASLNLHGTRSVQKVVELCSQEEEPADESAADILTAALAPAAARLCIDSHGNHVIQRILLKLGPKHTRFIFDAVAASVSDVARHRHGCCVIQRCLDSSPGEARAHLVLCIVDKSLELMQDAYGNYVVQYVLDVCSDADVHAVCESVVGKVSLLAIQKFSSNVMEKCLERCSDAVKEQYMRELSDPDRIRELMMDPFGNYVVQRALSVATHAQAVALVEAMRPHLLSGATGPHGQRNGGVRNTAGGRRIIAKICRRFPNFTLNAPTSQEELYSSNSKRPHYPQAPQQASTMSYAPLGAPSQYDPRLAPGHSMMPAATLPSHQQHQPYYNINTSPYYESQPPQQHPYGNGFPGM